MKKLYITTIATSIVTTCLMLSMLMHPSVPSAPEPTPMPTRAVSGIGGTYHFDNHVCEHILVSGTRNKVYVDHCDVVTLSGIDNQVVQVLPTASSSS